MIKSLFLFARFALFKKPLFSRQIEIRLSEGVRFKIDYTFGLCRYERFGDRHNCGYYLWLSHCRGKRDVFDIGAHIGLYSIPASKLLRPGGRVYAFEPSVANRRYLRRHCEYNGCRNIVIEPSVVGSETAAEVEFRENPRPDPMNALKAYKNQASYRTVLRPQVSLDDFCSAKNVSPELIKIDVEGAELEVLRGARRILKEGRPLVFLSLHPQRLALLGHTAEEVSRFAAEIGYRIVDVAGNPVNELAFGEYLLIPD